MPYISLDLEDEDSSINGIMELIPDLMYCSYATQRDNGITHENCLKMGLGQESFDTRYNNENKPSWTN